MTRRIVIDPVTRIEGHAKITLMLDDAGRLTDARFHVTEFRGFEKFCEGRSFREMPALTSRICGICPVSHLIASARAGDALLAVSIPPVAEKLRRLVHLAQIVQSHALSVFHLSGPDLFLGYDAPPAERNLFGLARARPELARQGIRLRQFGQEIIEALTGKRIASAWIVPGGVTAPLTAEKRAAMLAGLPEALGTIAAVIAEFRASLPQRAEEIATCGDFPSLFLGTVSAEGDLDPYAGGLRLTDGTGQIVVDHVDPVRYDEFFGEVIESWSFLKFPFYRPLGYPEGAYRVGPLARLNVATRCGTPRADEELAFFRTLGPGAVQSSFHFHYARMIEILFALEKIERLLHDPDILDPHVLARAELNRREAVGATEAPRGTLFHHYQVDDHGLVRHVNLLIATGQNNLSMSRTIRQLAERFVDGPEIPDAVLNRIEAGVRAYDPCLSCSTHAVGKMPLHVRVVDRAGRLLGERFRPERGG